MANGLNEALLALPMRPVDTIYGQLSSNVLQNIPNMINPYGSTWEAAGIGLGSVLTSALLGYQARKQAREENALMQPLLTQALQARTPEEIDILLQQPGAARMTDLGTQLKLSILQNKAAAEAKKAELAQEMQLALVKEGYIPKGMEDLIDPASIGALNPKELKGLEIDRLKAQNEENIKKPQRDADRQFQIDKELQTIKNTVANDPITKMYEESAVNLETAKKLASTDSAASTLALKKIVERALNPGNQVTLQELRGYGEILPVLQKYEGWARSKTQGLSDLPAPARQELLGIVQSVVSNLGEAYNKRANNALFGAQQAGWTDNVQRVAPLPLWQGSTSQITREQALAELARRKAAKGQ